jgi:hypothetical protein
MKKLVIQTQYLENYGSKDAPYMKFKGGNTFVMPNCGDMDSNEIATLITQFKDPALMTFESSNGGCESYITDVSVVPHTDKVCESWETVTTFTFNKDERQFYFMKVTDNREDGYMRSEILEKTETWVGTSGAGRKFYKAEFLMRDGDICEGEEDLKNWFDTCGQVEVV